MTKQFFVFRGIDRVASGGLREATASAQKAYNARSSQVRMVHGGALFSTNGGALGTCLIVEADALALARDWIDASPFVKSGLFDTVTLERWGWRSGQD